MEESQYNFWSQTPQGAPLLFNGLTGALLELEPDERDAVRTALSGELNEHTSLLQAFGFLVGDRDSERARLLTRLERAPERSEVLELTISPSYACNFRCTYCYVHFEDQRMTPEVAAKVVAYTDRELPGHTEVNITWFGGEPLLQWRLVAETAALLAQCGARHDRVVRQFLTTNGYLLVPRVTAALVEAGIRYFHITIDGADSGQDQRRVLRTGQPTYERVLNNLIGLLSDHPIAHVTLRMNLEVASLGQVEPLLTGIPSSLRARIQVHATPVIRAGVDRPAELHRGVADAIALALSLGYQYYDNAIPVGRERHCTAESASTFQIGPGGELHKCSPSGKPEVTVGVLDEAGGAELDPVSAGSWGGVQLPEECANCRYLCFCGGGCLLTRMRGDTDPHCRDPYEPMDALVRNRWLDARTTPVGKES